ncbi:MAG: response regulator transcription factor [Verrucomicrobiota bacterium]
MRQYKTIHVAVVEDDSWVRENLAREIGNAAGFECSGSFATAEAALAAIPLCPPEVVVLDINLPGIDGIECLRQLRVSCPMLQFLMLTSYEESEKIFQSLRAGANGYLLKRADTSEVIDAIRQVHEGGAPMSSSIARQVVRHFNQLGNDNSELPRLSPREREVLELLARGAAYKEIAGHLALSIETIRMNVKHIYTKLHVHSRGEAVAKFLHRK